MVGSVKFGALYSFQAKSGEGKKAFNNNEAKAAGWAAEVMLNEVFRQSSTAQCVTVNAETGVVLLKTSTPEENQTKEEFFQDAKPLILLARMLSTGFEGGDPQMDQTRGHIPHKDSVMVHVNRAVEYVAQGRSDAKNVRQFTYLA
jgi:hypothetical protein